MSDTNESNHRPSKPRKRRRPLWQRAIVFVAILYAAWCLALFLVQDWLIFPADIAPDPLPKPPISTIETWWRDIEDGQRVEAWFAPAPGFGPTRPAPAVIYFHGNAELIDYQTDVIRGYHRLGYSVLLPEYRSYGRSGGEPSQSALHADAVAFHDRLAARPDIDPDRIVIHGFSLGGAVAADLARERPPAALILQSTFTRMGAMAHRFAAPGCIARHPFRTDEVVQNFTRPLLIFHGTRDIVIPVSHGRQLAALNPDATYVEYSTGHSDMPTGDFDSNYWQAIDSFLNAIHQ